MDFAKIQKLINENETDKAGALLDFENQSVDPREAITKAKYFLKTNSPENAMAVLKENTKIFPTHAPTYLELGILYFDLKAYEDAIQAFLFVLNAQQNNLIAKNYLALIDLINGNFETTTNQLKLEKITDNIGFRVRLIEYIELQWLVHQTYFSDESTDTINSSENEKPNPKKALNSFYRRQFDKMAKYLPQPPVESDEIAFLGAISSEMCNKFELALRYLENHDPGKETAPDLIKAVYGRCLIRTGNFPLGAEILNSVEITGPEDYGINYYMGLVNLAWGKKDAARFHFTTALTTYMVDTLDFQWPQLISSLSNQINKQMQY